MPHMLSCGNNDLISKKFSDAYGHYIYEDEKFFTSAYAYDVGYTHFVCLNSNTDSSALTSSGGPYESHDAFLQAEAEWLDQHLTEVKARATKPRWIILYAHLSPFTVGRTIRLQRWVSVVEKHKVDLFLCGHNHAYARSKALYTGFDYSKSPAYNDYVTTVSKGSTELKIVDEFKGDGVTEINRAEDKANGTVYILNQACGFKLSGKEKPITLPSNLQGTKHANTEGGPWWVAKQDTTLNKDPMYCTLDISYNKIDFKAYYVTGILGYDQYKNKTLNEDLSKVNQTLYDSLTINYSERNK